MITSTSNQKVKELIRLKEKSRIREEEKLFLAEGPRMAEEIPMEWIDCLYVSESYEKKCGEQTAAYKKAGVRTETLSDEVFARVSDTKTPQGVLAAVHMPEYSFADILGVKKAAAHTHVQRAFMQDPFEGHFAARDGAAGRARLPLVLVLDNLQDPGNMGTVFRSAEAAGASGILMSKDCVDVYNPKVIRSTMGAIFRLPFYRVEDLPGAVMELKAGGLRVYAAHLEGRRTYDGEDYRRGCAFMIGNEGNGLRQEVAECADCRIRIPMEGCTESLNAAVAASILLFEAARQRRGKERNTEENKAIRYAAA